MSANFEAKKQLVQEIKEKLSKAKSVTFVDFSGLTVEQDTKMRKAFRESGNEYKVYKNRLMLLALNELGITGADKYLEGLTAVAFSFSDEVAAPKVVMKNVEESNKLKVKFGIVDNKIVSCDEIKTLATLPSKEELIAKLLGTLNATATNLVSVLSAPTRGLAVALNAIANK